MKQAMKFFLALLIGAFLPLTGNAAVFGWSGSGAGPGSGANTAWLTSGNWTNNSGLPGAADFAWFGAGGSATSIGINFNAPPAVGSTNLGVIVLGAGSTVNRTIGNSATTAGIATRLYLTGIGGGLITNAVSGRTLTLAPYAGGSTVAMTNVLLNSGVIEAVGGVTLNANIIEAGGARGITKTGNGLLLLTGSNTYSGGTIINGGIVSVGTGGTGANTAATNSLGTGTVTANTGGQLRLWIQNSTTHLIPNAVTLAGGTLHNEDGIHILQNNVSVTANSTVSARWNGKYLIIPGVVSGAGGLTIDQVNGVNGGVVMMTNLTAANTYSGRTTIRNGTTLVIDAQNRLGANPVSEVANQLLFDNGILSNTFPVTINDSFRGLTITNGGGTFAPATNLTVVHNIIGPGALTKAGANNSQLTLQGTNAFAGNVNVNNGGLIVKNSASLGTGTKTLNLTSGTAGNGHLILDNTGSGADINLGANISLTTSWVNGTVTNTAGNNVIQGNFTLAGGGGGTFIAANGGTLTLRGNLTPNTTARDLRLGGTSTGTNTVAGGILDGGGANTLAWLTKTDNGVWRLTGTNTYTGPTFVTGGQLVVAGNGSISNSSHYFVGSGATLAGLNPGNPGFTLVGTQAMSGFGTVIGPVTLHPGTRLSPGTNFSVGNLTLSNALTLNNGTRLDLDLGTDPLSNSGSNDLIVVQGNLALSGTVAVQFSFPRGAPTLGQPYTLLRYSGSLSGSAANLAAVGLSGYAATFDTATAPGYVTVTFAAGSPNNLTWTGTNGFNWNLNTTANFTNTAGAAVTFSQGDHVLFNNATTNQTVTLVGNYLHPSSVTVNSSSNYTFNGSGGIAGGDITKTGNGIFTLGTANTTPGTITVAGGSLRLGQSLAVGSEAGATYVTNGGTLDINGQRVGNLASELVVISGTGVGGTGAVVNLGAGQNSALRRVTLASDASVGGLNRFDIRNDGGSATLSSEGQPHKFTKRGPNDHIWVGVEVDPALGDIEILQGRFGAETSTSGSLGNAASNVLVASGATFRWWTWNNFLSKRLIASNNATLFVDTAANGISGPVVLDSGMVVVNPQTDGTRILTINGPVSGAGGFMKIGLGTLVLNGTNTFTGFISNSAGLVQGTTYGLAGAITNNAALVINQAVDGTLAGPVTGTGSLLKRGTGRVTITNPMGMTGIVTNEAGTIALGADNVLGTGLQDWRGAGGLFPAFESADGSTRTITNAISISTDTRLGSAGSGNLVFSGPINNGGAQKILTISNAVTTFSSGFATLGTIVKSGPGQLTLGGPNNNANFAVSNGTMTLAVGGYFSNSPNMTIASGAVLDVSAGSGATFTNISGRTLIAGRAGGTGNDIVGSLQSTGTITIGAPAAPATLSVSGNVLIGGGTLNFDLGSTTAVGGGVSD